MSIEVWWVAMSASEADKPYEEGCVLIYKAICLKALQITTSGKEWFWLSEYTSCKISKLKSLSDYVTLEMMAREWGIVLWNQSRKNMITFGKRGRVKRDSSSSRSTLGFDR